MAKDPIKALEALEKNLDKLVARVLDDCVFRIKRRVDSQEFIHWKSRRKPIVVEKARLVGELMTATVRGASRWTWGSVLIGPPGQTVIKAKKGMLAIPLDATKWLGKQKARPSQYGGTWVQGGVIMGYAGWAGAAGYTRQRRAAGETFGKGTPVPLFALKGSVVVRRRVIPSELINWIKPYFREQLQKRALRVA
jgi:hypothetical protein